MAVRFHAEVKRVSGDPTPLDPGSTSTDFSCSRNEAHYKRPAAEERIKARLSGQFGGEWEVTKMHTTFLSKGSGLSRRRR